MNDTSEKAEKVLIELLRKKSVSERLSQVFALSEFVRNLSKRAIQRANPN